MTRTSPINLIKFTIIIRAIITLIFLIKSPLIISNNYLALAITIDLLITIPFTYYLFIKKSEIPKTTVVPVMIIGLLIGTYFLPKEHQTYLN